MILDHRYYVHIACDDDLDGYECCSPASDSRETLEEAIALADEWPDSVWSTSIYDMETKSFVDRANPQASDGET